MKHAFSNVIPMKPSEPLETPYLKAQQSWDERIGSNVIRAKNWRYAFFAQTLFSVLLVSMLIMIQSKREVVPILIGVEENTGKRIALGPVAEQDYSPRPLEVKYFMSEFIRYVRAVPTDQIVIKENWLRAYAFLRKDASNLLNEMTNNDPNSPLKKIGETVVSVQPLSVVQIPDTESYQMRWKETLYSKSGTKIDEYTMLGTFVLEFELPKDESTIKANPLGLYIKNFQWNKEL